MTAASSDSHGKDVHMLREKRINLNSSTGCTQNACGLRLKAKPGLERNILVHGITECWR
jgi:hypothetical protein